MNGARSSDVRTTDSFPTAQSLDGLDELLNAERPDDLIAVRFNLVSGHGEILIRKGQIRFGIDHQPPPFSFTVDVAFHERELRHERELLSPGGNP
jgi:hypothetical protein